MSHLGAVVVCQSMGRSVNVSVLTLRNGMLVDIISKLLLHKILHAGGFLSHAFVIVLRYFLVLNSLAWGSRRLHVPAYGM